MKLFILPVIFVFAFGQYEYTLEDVNPNSATFGTDVWYPSQSGKITAHYFSTQG